MNKVNEKLIESIQKLSELEGEYEVMIYGPTIRGSIFLSDGRIHAAKTGEYSGLGALRKLIVNLSTKYVIRKLEEGAPSKGSLDLSPADAFISIILNDINNDPEALVETQKIDNGRTRNYQGADLHFYDCVLNQHDESGETIEYTLAAGRNMLGRQEVCDIKIESKLTSRIHSIITVSSKGVILTDAQTLNGTKVNNEFVTTAELHDGDEIEIGGVILTVSFRLKVRHDGPHTDNWLEDKTDDILSTQTRRVHFADYPERVQKTIGISNALSEIFKEQYNETVHLGIVKNNI